MSVSFSYLFYWKVLHRVRTLARVASVGKGRGRELGRETAGEGWGRRRTFSLRSPSCAQIPPSPSPYNACVAGYTHTVVLFENMYFHCTCPIKTKILVWFVRDFLKIAKINSQQENPRKIWNGKLILTVRRWRSIEKNKTKNIIFKQIAQYFGFATTHWFVAVDLTTFYTFKKIQSVLIAKISSRKTQKIANLQKQTLAKISSHTVSNALGTNFNIILFRRVSTYRVFSLTWPVSMQIYWNKRKRLHKKEFNSQRTGLGHQHGRRFIVLGHQYGRRDVMWKHSIGSAHGEGGGRR